MTACDPDVTRRDAGACNPRPHGARIELNADEAGCSERQVSVCRHGCGSCPNLGRASIAAELQLRRSNPCADLAILPDIGYIGAPRSRGYVQAAARPTVFASRLVVRCFATVGA